MSPDAATKREQWDLQKLTEQDVHGDQVRRREGMIQFLKMARRKKKMLKFMEVRMNTGKGVDRGKKLKEA